MWAHAIVKTRPGVCVHAHQHTYTRRAGWLQSNNPKHKNVSCVNATRPRFRKRVDRVLQAVCTGALTNGLGARTEHRQRSGILYLHQQPAIHHPLISDHSLGLTLPTCTPGRDLVADSVRRVTERMGWFAEPFRGRPAMSNPTSLPLTGRNP